MFYCRDDQGEYECSFADKFVLPLFDGLDASPIATAVKASAMVVPWAGVAHLLALGLLGGAIFMADAKALGAGLKSHTTADVERNVRPILFAAVALAIVSGGILALGELKKLYYSPPYWLKMATFASALLFTFGVRNRLIANAGKGDRLTYAIWAAIGVAWLGVFAFMSNWLARGALFLLLGALGATVWRRRATLGPNDLALSVAAICSIVLWLTTAAAGRWIAFY